MQSPAGKDQKRTSGPLELESHTLGKLSGVAAGTKLENSARVVVRDRPQ